MKQLNTEIPEAVRDALGEAVFTPGSRGVRIERKLDRKLYSKVNEVLEALGGKWNKKAQAHLFDVDAKVRIEGAIQTGTFTPVTALDFFETPLELGRSLLDFDLELYEVSSPLTWRRWKNSSGGGEWTALVLEPSAGRGALVDVINTRWPTVDIRGIEIRPEFVEVMQRRFAAHDRLAFLAGDFLLGENPEPICDAVVMNPPFSNQVDIDHITRAMCYLKPGGYLRAIASASIRFRKNKKTEAFLELIAKHGGKIEDNDPDAFAASGTHVRTVTIRLQKQK